MVPVVIMFFLHPKSVSHGMKTSLVLHIPSLGPGIYERNKQRVTYLEIPNIIISRKTVQQSAYIFRIFANKVAHCIVRNLASSKETFALCILDPSYI